MKYIKLCIRLLLGIFMTYAGISHLTIARQEFVAQVPTWLQFSPGFTDFVVQASGVVEIALGLGMLFLWKKKSTRRRAACSILCTNLPRQHQPVCESYRCLRSQHRSGSSHPTVLPACTHLPHPLDNRRLGVLQETL